MMYKLPSSSRFGSRLVCGMGAAFTLCLLLARAASAQTYVNNQNTYFNIPNGPLLTNIDATAFANKSIFSTQGASTRGRIGSA